VRDDDRQVAQQRVVELRGRARGQPKERSGRVEARKKGEDEEEAQFGRASGEIVVEQRPPGMPQDDANRDALKVP